MPDITMAPDTLNLESLKFKQNPLKKSIFLNSVPKSGSHLLRNILRMFIMPQQVYSTQFVQWPTLQQHVGAFDKNRQLLISAHLLYADNSATLANRTHKLMLVRDPYSWVLAQARFFVSDVFSSNFDQIKNGSLTIDDLIGLMIFGIYQKSPPMKQQYDLYASAWLATDAYVVRYEDLIENIAALDSSEAKTYFKALLAACGIEMPSDWKARISIGADKKQSPTARDNINDGAAKFDFPDALTDKHRALVDYAAPGLRALLGYS